MKENSKIYKCYQGYGDNMVIKDIIVPEGGENLVALEMILGRVEKHIAAQPPFCGAGEDGAV